MLCLCLSTAAMGAQAQPPLPAATLRIGAHVLQVEVANTPASLREGLMHRTQLPPDGGMLFQLGPPDDLYCFWMKNTLLPLSIAFIDADGRIVSIQDMQPQSLGPHCPPVAITTALEMSQGWFARAGINVGDRVRGIPPAHNAEQMP